MINEIQTSVICPGSPHLLVLGLMQNQRSCEEALLTSLETHCFASLLTRGDK